MASYPSSVKTFRTIENRNGAVYDADDTKTLFAEDIEAITDEIVAIETELIAKGWIGLSVVPTLQEDQEPNYVLRFTSDITSYLSVGHKIKFTQNGATVYGIIVAVGAFSAGVVDIVVYCGTDYSVLATATYAITNFKYSREKMPLGFPIDPRKWTITFSDTTLRTQATPTVNVWYNTGSLSLNIPIGLWKVMFKCMPYLSDASATAWSVRATLSTEDDSETNSNLTISSRINGTGFGCVATVFDEISLAVETPHYINISTPSTGLDNIYLRNDVAGTALVVKVLCAYL